MKNIKSYPWNSQFNSFPTRPPSKWPFRTVPCVLGSNLEGKWSPKNVLSLSAAELRSLKWVLGDKCYGYEPQLWIGRETKLTPTRRSFLRAILFEAGVARDYCYWRQPDKFFDPLHNIWHKLDRGRK